jgi:dihydrofolate reductase
MKVTAKVSKIIYAMSISLDGFIEDANGDISWSYPDEERHKHFNEQEALIDIHLYGRRLYETMASYWPTIDENINATKLEREYANIWKGMPKVVFSKTLKKVDWNSRLISENIAEEVNKLKEQSDKTMSVSGAGIAASFTKLGLIDEYWQYVNPVVLGNGKSMFQQLQSKVDLKLIETRVFRSGVVLLRYAYSNSH